MRQLRNLTAAAFIVVCLFGLQTVRAQTLLDVRWMDWHSAYCDQTTYFWHEYAEFFYSENEYHEPGGGCQDALDHFTQNMCPYGFPVIEGQQYYQVPSLEGCSPMTAEGYMEGYLACNQWDPGSPYCSY